MLPSEKGVNQIHQSYETPDKELAFKPQAGRMSSGGCDPSIAEAVPREDPPATQPATSEGSQITNELREASGSVVQSDAFVAETCDPNMGGDSAASIAQRSDEGCAAVSEDGNNTAGGDAKIESSQSEDASSGARIGKATAPKSKHVCSVCGTESTPIWRKGQNQERLCNACGLKARKSLRISQAAEAGAYGHGGGNPWMQSLYGWNPLDPAMSGPGGPAHTVSVTFYVSFHCATGSDAYFNNIAVWKEARPYGTQATHFALSGVLARKAT